MGRTPTSSVPLVPSVFESVPTTRLASVLEHRLLARSYGAAFGRLRMGLATRDPVVLLGLLILLSLIVRFVAIFAVPLAPEEAYYWMYSQHPAMSYYDHPPMVAWVIGAGTWVFGNNEFGVRIVGSLLMFAASAQLYLFGRIWFGRQAGLLAAAMLHILPIYFGIGFVATMDSALMFFWTLGLLAVTLALTRSRSWGWWYIAGVALGGAMLSKYTGVFLGAGAGLAVLVHRPWRRQLLSIHPYLAFGLAIAIFSPTIVWNARHDWASFRFQFVGRWDEDSGSYASIFVFIGYQFLMLTPLLLAGIAFMFVRLKREHRLLQPRWLIATCFSLPLLAVMTQKSIKHGIHINWTAPVYASLLPALAWLFLARVRAYRTHRRGPDWARGIGWTVALCVVANIGLFLFLLTLQPRLQWLAPFGPWKELAGIVEAQEERVETETGREPLVVAEGKYRLASVMAFYRSSLETRVRSSDFTTSQWRVDGREGLGYPYWASEADWKQSTTIYIDDDNDMGDVEKRFDKVEVVYDSGHQYAKRYHIAVCSRPRE